MVHLFNFRIIKYLPITELETFKDVDELFDGELF